MIHRHDVPPLDRKISVNGSSASARCIGPHHTMVLVTTGTAMSSDARRQVVQ